jgi:hypothetical protein
MGGEVHSSDYPADQWQTARLGDVLELSIPAGMSVSEAYAFESPTGMWEGDDMTVLVDATMYADDLRSQSASPRAKTATEHIDGRPARIVSYEDDNGTPVIAAHVMPLQAATGAAPAGVTVVVRGGPLAAPDIPLQIIRSLRFI